MDSKLQKLRCASRATSILYFQKLALLEHQSVLHRALSWINVAGLSLSPFPQDEIYAILSLTYNWYIHNNYVENINISYFVPFIPAELATSRALCYVAITLHTLRRVTLHCVSYIASHRIACFPKLLFFSTNLLKLDPNNNRIIWPWPVSSSKKQTEWATPTSSIKTIRV